MTRYSQMDHDYHSMRMQPQLPYDYYHHYYDLDPDPDPGPGSNSNSDQHILHSQQSPHIRHNNHHQYHQFIPSGNNNVNVNMTYDPVNNRGIGTGAGIGTGMSNLNGTNLNTATTTATFLTAGGSMLPLDLMRNRQPAQIVAAVDGMFAVVLLVFHGLTLMVQDMAENRSTDNWLLPKVPMTPGMLNITGYMEVIAWIGILSINFLQLLVAVSLFNASHKKCLLVKAFEASQVWLKTCIFLLCILLIKLCILYFMYEMNMRAQGTIIFTSIETIFHFVGLVVIFKYYSEMKRNDPMASQIFYHADDDEEDDDSSSPKRNNVADAVWF